MFQSLRPNNQVFILHKDRAVLETGSVVSVSTPMPKYPVQPMFGQPQEMVVDIVVKVNNQDITYQKIPANLDIADFNNSNIVLSDNREAMNSEISSLKQKSIAIINSIDFHKEMISNCDKILSELNPEFAEKQQQQLEINSLKTQMGEMAKSITELMSMNKKLISQLNKE
jgi:hypothetical protein|uniref:Uncharacterized protein n=1 Tax=virus sp. ctrcb4 TaxID=2825824 RepID=A0A8S5RPW6_9VIRU|nr:MAG TPA: hypothetical protein [virus sp. ctrcb4]DAH01204.1 MAG TPA: hypothetical protein [Crassvirales sp.]